MKKIILLILFLSFLFFCFAEDRSIYFLIIDRFYNARADDFSSSKDDIRKFYGGDIKGILDKLSYIENMGFKYLWISPVFEGRKKDFFGNWGFHGYWVVDFFKADPRFGSIEEIALLSSRLKSKNRGLLLDMVFNHTDWDSPLYKEHPEMFHPKHDIENWNDPYELENYSMGGLPDLDQAKPETYDYLLKVAKFWIDKVKPAGFRMDAVKHIPHSFWKRINKDIKAYAGENFYIIGEVLQQDPALVAEYLNNDGFDGIFDFPLYYKISSVFAKDADMRELKTIFQKDAFYDEPNNLLTFIDNHDVPRFASGAGLEVKNKIKLALGFIYTVRGNPVVYYGTEEALPGDSEPYNRAPMEWRDNEDIAEYISLLSSIRKTYRSLTDGIQMVLDANHDTMSYLRISSNELSTIVINNNYSPTLITVNLPLDIFIKEKSITTKLGKKRINIRNNSFSIKVLGKSIDIIIFKNGSFTKAISSIKEKRDADRQRLTFKRAIIFRVKNVKIDFGQKLYLVGNNRDIGSWNYKKAIGPFKFNNGAWEYKAELNLIDNIEFKLIILAGDKPIWEPGKNHILYSDSRVSKEIKKVELSWNQ